MIRPAGHLSRRAPSTGRRAQINPNASQLRGPAGPATNAVGPEPTRGKAPGASGVAREGIYGRSSAFILFRATVFVFRAELPSRVASVLCAAKSVGKKCRACEECRVGDRADVQVYDWPADGDEVH